MKRKIELVVISDTHLGTYGCHAKELHNYLKSIKPDVLILNGDIIDIWQFKKSYFPKDHLLVVNRLLKLLTTGTKIYYITGNHDDTLRGFSEFSNGNFFLRDQLSLNLHGKKYWIFHGDVFDVSILKARWLAKLGGSSYDWLIRVNRFFNSIVKILGFKPTSFAKSMKMGVKKAVKFIADFEEKAINMAQTNGYDYVICGHIHKPQIRKQGTVTYLNSGDWVESLSALEYNAGDWRLYKYDPLDYDLINPKLHVGSASHYDEDDRRIVQPQLAILDQILSAKSITLGE
jgi:UDP-2,3-diacylglucosamine pyrophosphatase LpxH